MATSVDSLCAEYRNVLLVEGQDDLHVVLQLYKKTHEERPLVPEVFCIRDMRGDTSLLAGMNDEIRSGKRVIVGVIIDADRDDESGQPADAVAARWKEVTDKLEEIGIAVPPERTDGIVIPGKPDGAPRLAGIGIPPRIGVWVMPDNEHPGEIEDFITTMIPSDAKARLLAKDYIGRTLTEISLNDDAERLREGKRLRGEVHAWLATRRRPRHLGAAIEAAYLDTDGELCQRFTEWLRRLFGEPAG